MNKNNFYLERYPIPDRQRAHTHTLLQNKMVKIFTVVNQYFRPKRLKNHTLWLAHLHIEKEGPHSPLSWSTTRGVIDTQNIRRYYERPEYFLSFLTSARDKVYISSDLGHGRRYSALKLCGASFIDKILETFRFMFNSLVFLNFSVALLYASILT